ncbi:hypothetical protein [Nocardia sp. CNY236]|uniref:hypothetical protein n=1 Tax=Nocardia sp. CNY236 TaxID=1169152 RepID=UPI00041C0CAA|nr:hypothetical protein [Nocardia sp. CNY236]
MSADTEGIAAYGEAARAMASDMAQAGASAATATPAALGPVMGLVGADFMTAYSAAHAGHLAAIGQLSAVLTSVGGAAQVSAATLAETDAANASILQNATTELE